MNEIPVIDSLINWLLGLVPLGCGIVAVRCFIGMSTNEDDYTMFKKRLKNALIFCVIAECLVGLLKIIASYYGG